MLMDMLTLHELHPQLEHEQLSPQEEQLLH